MRTAEKLDRVAPLAPGPRYPLQAADQHTVALLCRPGPEYVVGTLATWLSGGIAVPLCLSHPLSELEYVVHDAGVSALLTDKENSDKANQVVQKYNKQIEVQEVSCEPSVIGSEASTLPTSMRERYSASIDWALQSQSPGALIVYTSGTTGRPKGALHTFRSLDAQIQNLTSCWEWTDSDTILHTLPLHHIHGIVNALYCPLATGAMVNFLPKFSPSEVWNLIQQDCVLSDQVKGIIEKRRPITVFMGVPTMYSFLLNVYDDAPAKDQASMSAAASNLRLAVSGSAACPLPIMRRWKQLAGTFPLERYGMTETGMLLGNPLHGERRPGTVGFPFPGIEARIDPGTGELGVKGPQLFAGYWGRPDASKQSFDDEGYFLTGDTAQVEPETGYYKLLGRTSVDIIKSGGYKISALDIESVLLDHPDIKECAVLGIPDPEYGERIAAVITCKRADDCQSLTLAELKQWTSSRLAPYQTPSRLEILPSIPRNAMGKINKKDLRKRVFPEYFGSVAGAA